MNLLPFNQKTKFETTAASNEPLSAAVVRILNDQPELGPAVNWLQKNGVNPNAIVADVLDGLIKRGRHLPGEVRRRYAAKVMAGHFFARWAEKHKATTVRALQENAQKNQDEVRPFQMALIAVGSERAFKRVIPRLARTSHCGGAIGNADDFSCFVMINAAVLAHRFLKNFDSTVFNAPAKSLNYLEVTAVSHYLHSRSREARDDEGLAGHLARSSKLGTRAKLAAKLAYLPSLLTKPERDALRVYFGIKGSFAKRMRVKDVAATLKYPSAATLSRKLYRVREWAENERARRAARDEATVEGTTDEVQY